MAGGRGKDSELPKVREDFGGSIYLEPKLQDSVKGSTNKRLHYVMYLVFHCELFHKKVSLFCPLDNFTTSRLQLAVQKGNFLSQRKVKITRKTSAHPPFFLKEQIKLN